jgi:transposase
MKKPMHPLIAEVPRSVTKVGMTIGIDLGDVWSHYCTLNEDGEVVDRGRFRTTLSGVEKWFTDVPGHGLRWRLGPIRSGSANNSENWATK